MLYFSKCPWILIKLHQVVGTGITSHSYQMKKLKLREFVSVAEMRSFQGFFPPYRTEPHGCGGEAPSGQPEYKGSPNLGGRQCKVGVIADSIICVVPDKMLSRA